MAKYSQKLVDRICSLIREDSYTIAEICDLVGINKDTYYTWMKTKSDFSDSIKKAEDARMQFFVAEAQKSLLKKIQGYEVEESKITYVDSGKPVVDENGKEKQKPKVRSWKEQNYISNAKMMLMQRNHLSEDEAYRYIQKSSMDSGTNMVETAQMLLMLLYDG